MRQSVPVRIGSAEVLVETAAKSGGGLKPVDGKLPGGPGNFDGIRDTIKAVSGELVAAWENSGASEATVEFGIAAEVKAGRLTGLLVGGLTAARASRARASSRRPDSC